VTIDDVLRVAEAAATEDIQKIGGTAPLDEPYIVIGLRRMITKRAGWLVVLFLGELFTATAMGFFGKEIEKAVVLALFVPLIISSGGNSGSQASTLVVRALAIGEIGLRDWWRVMRREFIVGFALGSILGTIGFLRIALWSWLGDLYGPHWLLVALTVAISLVGVVMWGALSGSLLPLILRRMGFDPSSLLGAVCRNNRRRNGAGDLFQRRVSDYARDIVVADIATPWGAPDRPMVAPPSQV
jgi:magnesium transporter